MAHPPRRRSGSKPAQPESLPEVQGPPAPPPSGTTSAEPGAHPAPGSSEEAGPPGKAQMTKAMPLAPAATFLE
jgi:hypothetical protein